jgi:hypothetical protein
MGMRAPAFLFGLLALGLPLYLHLLRRHASTPRPFSSLRFFEPRTHSSVRQRRLRYLLLLAARLALLALLVLAFTEPFVLRSQAAASSSRLVLLLIDRSFSMRAGARLEQAKREALAVLEQRRASDRLQVMSLGSQLQVLSTPTQDLALQRAAVTGIEADDSRADLSAVVSAARQAIGTTHLPLELHLFSDMQHSSLPTNFLEMTLPDTVSLVLHSVAPSATPNWSVEHVTAPGQIWGGAKDVKPAAVQAVVAGFDTPAADRVVSLFVNGKSVASQTVHVPAGGRVTVAFTNLQVPHGWSRCEVRLDSGDVLPQDDTYRFAVERSDPRQALFIHAETDSRSPLYFGHALAAADGSAFTLQSVAVGAAARLSLEPYAFVVLANLASLPPALQSALERYVRGGGSVLLALGTGAAGHAVVPLFDGAIGQSHDFAGGPSQGLTRFASVGETDPAQVWAGDTPLWSGVKIFYALQVDAAHAQVLARLTDGSPLLLEQRLGEGRVLLLASGLDGLTNDLPLHPAFVAFVSQWAHHLSGMQPDSSARVVDAFLPLHAATGAAASSDSGRVEVIDPDGHRPLSLTEAASTATLRLSRAGFYELRRVNGQQELVAVNVDPRESDLTVIPSETLGLLGRSPRPQNASVPVPGATGREPDELWWFIMLLALMAALAQSWLGDRQLRSDARDVLDREAV